MKYTGEKGGGTFEGIRLLLCENPLPPLDEAIEAAERELPMSNFYTEAYSERLKGMIADEIGIDEKHIHINAGSELILRQLFSRFGKQVHLLTPTYSLFPEIARTYTETRLEAENDFNLDLQEVEIPENTSLFVIVNPNNPNGSVFNMDALPTLLNKYPETYILVDEAFIGLAGKSVAHLVPEYNNLLVTRTFSKSHSLAGFRVGYAILPRKIAAEFDRNNDAYPLARPSEAAVIATLEHIEKINVRTNQLKKWKNDLESKLNDLGIRTYPSETYFFLADFSPIKSFDLAERLAKENIKVKALSDHVPGNGFMRITTSTPENNEKFINSLSRILEEMQLPSIKEEFENS